MSDHRLKFQSLGKSLKSLGSSIKNIISPTKIRSLVEIKIPTLTSEIVKFVVENREKILEFAKKEWFAENVEFLIEVDAFERLRTDAERIKKFKSIFTEYLDRDSSKAVNISNRTYSELKEIQNKFETNANTTVSSNLFSSAKTEVANMIRDNLMGPRADEFAAIMGMKSASQAARLNKKKKKNPKRRRAMQKSFLLELTGPLYGAHTFKEYSDPEISFAVVDRKRCNKNKFQIKHHHDHWYFCHSYDRIVRGKIVYSGRWNQSFDASAFAANFERIEQEKRLIILVKNYEEFENPRTIKDVEIVIHLTAKGIRKLRDFFMLHF